MIMSRAKGHAVLVIEFVLELEVSLYQPGLEGEWVWVGGTWTPTVLVWWPGMECKVVGQSDIILRIRRFLVIWSSCKLLGRWGLQSSAGTVWHNILSVFYFASTSHSTKVGSHAFPDHLSVSAVDLGLHNIWMRHNVWWRSTDLKLREASSFNQGGDYSRRIDQNIWILMTKSECQSELKIGKAGWCPAMDRVCLALHFIVLLLLWPDWSRLPASETLAPLGWCQLDDTSGLLSFSWTQLICVYSKDDFCLSRLVCHRFVVGGLIQKLRERELFWFTPGGADQWFRSSGLRNVDPGRWRGYV